MNWLRKKLIALQNRPYEEKLKLLRRVAITAAILLLGFWILTLQFRKPPAASEPNKLAPVWENLKNLKNIIPQQTQP